MKPSLWFPASILASFSSPLAWPAELAPEANLGLVQAAYEESAGLLRDALSDAAGSGCFSEKGMREIWRDLRSAEAALDRGVRASLSFVAKEAARDIEGGGESCEAFRQTSAGIERKADLFTVEAPKVRKFHETQQGMRAVLTKVKDYQATDLDCAVEAATLEARVDALLPAVAEKINLVQGAYAQKERQLREHSGRLRGLLASCGKGDQQLSGPAGATRAAGAGRAVPKGSESRRGSDITGTDAERNKAIETKKVLEKQ